MRRLIVAGGTGFFGAAAVELLRGRGLSPLVASRHTRPSLDVEDLDSISRAVGPGDVVLDAVGPFQSRSTALIEAAVDIGFDVIDIADSLRYVRSLEGLAPRIAASQSRVFSACSSMSVISAAAVAWSGIHRPTRIRCLLLPAMRESRAGATALSLLASVGEPVEVFAKGRLQTWPGWKATWSMNLAGRTRHGRLFETADAIALPAIWPSLREVTSYVDPNVPGLGRILDVAARWPAVKRLMGRWRTLGLALGRMSGGFGSGLGYEISGTRGQITRVTISGGGRGHRSALLPGVLAVERLMGERPPSAGLIGVDRQVDPQQLQALLAAQNCLISVQPVCSRIEGDEGPG